MFAFRSWFFRQYSVTANSSAHRLNPRAFSGPWNEVPQHEKKDWVHDSREASWSESGALFSFPRFFNAPVSKGSGGGMRILDAVLEKKLKGSSALKDCGEILEELTETQSLMCNRIGIYLFQSDPETAENFFQSSGSSAALFNLGNLYETRGERAQAAEAYKKAAEMGHCDAMYNLAVLLSKSSPSFPKNLPLAKKYMRKAADAGCLSARQIVYGSKYKKQLPPQG